MIETHCSKTESFSVELTHGIWFTVHFPSPCFTLYVTNASRNCYNTALFIFPVLQGRGFLHREFWLIWARPDGSRHCQTWPGGTDDGFSGRILFPTCPDMLDIAAYCRFLFFCVGNCRCCMLLCCRQEQTAFSTLPEIRCHLLFESSWNKMMETKKQEKSFIDLKYCFFGQLVKI